MRKFRRVISQILFIIMVSAAAIGALTVNVAADYYQSYNQFYNEYNEHKHAGEYTYIPNVKYMYDPMRWIPPKVTYEFSDPSAVLVDGEAPPDKDQVFEYGQGGLIQFLKPQRCLCLSERKRCLPLQCRRKNQRRGDGRHHIILRQFHSVSGVRGRQPWNDRI